MVVVAARPGVGKTTFAMNLAYNAAREGKRFLVFSMEMTGSQIGRKLATMHAKQPLPINTHDPSRNARNAEILKSSLLEVADLPIKVDDSSRQDMSSIRATSKVVKRRDGLDAIVIDYLGLIQGDPTLQSKYAQVSELSKECKRLAMELNVVCFVVCQLNRDGANAEPRPENLRDSGQIEQDADIIMLLHREFNDAKSKEVKVIVAKNRFGGLGRSHDKIIFDPPTQQFLQVEQNKLSEGVHVHAG